MSILKTQFINKIKQTGVKVDEGQINAKNQVDNVVSKKINRTKN